MMNGHREPKRIVECWLGLIAFALPVCIAVGDATPPDDPDPARFAKAIDGFARWDTKSAWPADPILFVGSSSIRMWATRDAFPDWPVVNRGFGGAHISDVNHYFDRVVKPYAPRAIVFYCGDNDIAAGKSPQQVLADYKDFTKQVRDLSAEAQIVYLPIKPSVSRWKHWPAMQEANALIRTFIEADANHSYLDVATPMLDADGQPRKDLLAADGLHLSDQGYRVWNDALRAHVQPEVAADRAAFQKLYSQLQVFRDSPTVRISSRTSDHNDCEAFRQIVRGKERFLPFIVETIEAGDFFMNQAMREITGINVSALYKNESGAGGAKFESELWLRWWNERQR